MKKDLKSLVFFEDVKKAHGDIFFVGGIVRDFFLGKESKDLDLLIIGIPLDDLEQLLSKHGRVDSVGKSFGVLKFKAFGETEDIDIAIQRTEKKVGDGHRGFEVSYDHTLPIELELFRRDIKINSMAIDSNGNLIDPYGGMEDIKNKKISLTNPDAFKDDSLRMLRSIQFASRFDFTIEEQTFKSIKDNAHLIKEITGERIYIELEKIVSKGNKQIGLELLINTGLFKEIFGKEFQGDITEVNKATDMPEFIYLMLYNAFDNPSIIYKNVLKGELHGERKIEALTLSKLYDFGHNRKYLLNCRMLIHKMNKISQSSIDSIILPDSLKDVVISMKSGAFPLTIKDLDINGEDLMALGLKGKVVGDVISEVLSAIYDEKLKNDKASIIEYVKNR